MQIWLVRNSTSARPLGQLWWRQNLSSSSSRSMEIGNIISSLVMFFYNMVPWILKYNAYANISIFSLIQWSFKRNPIIFWMKIKNWKKIYDFESNLSGHSFNKNFYHKYSIWNVFLSWTHSNVPIYIISNQCKTVLIIFDKACPK